MYQFLKVRSLRAYYEALYAIDFVIWKVKNAFFSKQRTILRGIICPSVNAT